MDQVPIGKSKNSGRCNHKNCGLAKLGAPRRLHIDVLPTPSTVGGKSFEIAPAVFLRRLSMNLAIPLRKPICISDLEPISNPILFVPEKALRFQIHQRVVKIGARLKCCEGRTNLHERSCGAR